ncbi:MAG TPA: hypothetical protein VIZ60_18460, partial [Rubrobacter sp.]
VGTQLAIEATAHAEGALALAGAAPAGGYGLGIRLVLAGGVALYLAGIAFVDRVNEGTVGDRAVLVRLATAAFLAVLASIGASLSPPVFVALTALIMVLLMVFESIYDDRLVSE